MFEIAHELELLVESKARDDRLEHRPDGDVMRADERRVVHVREHAHQEPAAHVSQISGMSQWRQKNALAVHAVGHTAVAGDRVTKVLDVERALEARGEEATKGRYERSEAGKDDEVNLELRVVDRIPRAGQLR